MGVNFCSYLPFTPHRGQHILTGSQQLHLQHSVSQSLDLRRVYKIPTNTLYKMQRAPVYTGKIAFAGQIFEGKHEAPISANSQPSRRKGPSCAPSFCQWTEMKKAHGRLNATCPVIQVNRNGTPYGS